MFSCDIESSLPWFIETPLFAVLNTFVSNFLGKILYCTKSRGFYTSDSSNTGLSGINTKTA